MTITGASEIIPGQFRDKGGASVNVMHPDFGALGTGSGDDAAALALAMTSGTGKMVTFPALSFQVASQTSVPASTALAGTGRGSVLQTATISSHLLAVAAAGVMIRALKFTGVKGTTVLNNSAVVVGAGGTDVQVEDCELSGMSGIALHASATDNVRFVRNYVHGLTGDTGYVNSADVAFDAIVSYCTAAFNRLMGGSKTECGILLQNNSTKHLILGNQIGGHWSYGIIDYDTTSNPTTNTILALNRIEDIDGTGAATDFVKGAGIYTASTGGQIIVNNQIRNTNINTTTETLAPGAIGMNNVLSPVLVQGNLITATNWYGILITASTTATVELHANVFVECLKIPIYVKGSSHVNINGGSITALTTTPLLQRGVAVNVLGGGPFTGVAVRGVRIRGSSRAIEFVATNAIAVVGNVITEVNGASIRVTTGAGGVVADNYADSSTSAVDPALDIVSMTSLTVKGNVFKSTFTTCIRTSGTCTGSVFDESNVLVGMDMNNVDNAGTGMRFTLAGTAAPTVLNHQVGDKVINKAPSAGSPIAWECTTAGAPGTWTPIFGPNSSSADNGDASVTLTVASARTERFDTALTANRTVTLPSNGSSFNGQRFRIVRTGLGAFTLTVQDATPTTLKAMPSATAAYTDVEFNGTAWKLSGYGTL